MKKFLKFVAILALILTLSRSQASKARIFVYNWPDLSNRYANHTDRGHHVSHGVEIPQWRQNNGAGRLINPKFMEYKTSQYSLFKLIYERVLGDSRRTLDESRATSFLIPFDLGMHATFMENTGRMRRTGCPLAPEVIGRLKNSTSFTRNYGHDHILVVSINQNMHYYLSSPKCLELLRVCWNCTKISVDDYVFVAEHRRAELNSKGVNWHAVPFPSDYHFSKSYAVGVGESLPWSFNATRKRPNLVAFVGTARRFNEYSTALRESLLQQCANHQKECTHESYIHDAKHTLNDLSRNSVFCLQPPGDFPTRKSVFDSILSGCIPVLFHPLTARLMYEWHDGSSSSSRGGETSSDFWDTVPVNFDTISENQQLIGQSVDFIEKLIAFARDKPEEVTQKQKRIAEIAYSLQYSLEGSAGFSSPSNVDTPNMAMDAYDIIIDKVTLIHTGQLSHNRTRSFAVCKAPPIQEGDLTHFQPVDWCYSMKSTIDTFSPSYTNNYLLKV